MMFFCLAMLVSASAVFGQVDFLNLCSGAGSNVCLSVRQNPPVNGTPVRVAFFNGTLQQGWMMTPGESPIRTAEDPNFCLDADLSSGTLHVSQCDNSTTQAFHYFFTHILLPSTEPGLPSLCVTVGSALETCNDVDDPNQSWAVFVGTLD